MVTRSKFFFLYIVLICRARTSLCVGDTIASGESLSDKQTLTSNGGVFELGFFSRGTPSLIYVAIRYKNIWEKAVVWVANRDNPLTKTKASSSHLILSEDGNLVLMESGIQVWSTNLTPEPGNSTEAVLLDDGNLVLRDGSKSNSSGFIWQSFDYPTDTFLPGSKFRFNKITNKSQILTSWKSNEDPGYGMYSLHMEPDGAQLFLEWNRSRRYWTSGPWNGKFFNGVPSMGFTNIYNFSFISNEKEAYFTYSLRNKIMLSRLVIDASGQMRQLIWVEGGEWNLLWSPSRQQCKIYGVCGAFGSCFQQDTFSCTCLEGFEPRFQGLNDWYKGCARGTPLQCENKTSGTGRQDGFLFQFITVLPANEQRLIVAGAQQCKLACLKNCSCTAFTYDIDQCLLWYGEIFNLQKSNNNEGRDLYVRLAASDLPRNKDEAKKSLWWIVTLATVLAMLILCFFVNYMRKRKLKQRGESETTQDLLLFDLGTSTKANHGNYNDTSRLQNGEKHGAKLPLFSFSSVSAATENFSAANKLGQGGFGPVYKGKLRDGQEVAVKRLSKHSGQGLTEFRNEMLLIAQLQHRNLVRVLGCCVERDEMILVYEYMPYKSLDSLLFDPMRQQLLDWERRVHIITGIAQGLIYLHQYSRLRIIHRDLKASNILLDGEMNPKISDFGMARIFGGNDSEANTNRIVGTYGYMPPEYAMKGLFSIKSDVFSFGVLMLEILSGKKNTSFYHHTSHNLLEYAWELWKTGRGLELIDPLLSDPALTPLTLRYIQVALLCVQESPANRPTMPEVFSMFSNESAALPLPKEPAFFIGRREANANSGRGGPIHFSMNDVTITMEAR